MSCDECLSGSVAATDHLIQDMCVYEWRDNQHLCCMLQHTLFKAFCMSIISRYSHGEKLVIFKGRIRKIKLFDAVNVYAE